jgi:phosphatidylserine decarboxylase
VKFDRDGLPFVAIAGAPSAVALATRRPRLAAALLALPAAVGLFFRDPDRIPDLTNRHDPDDVLAPADAKVMHVGEPQPGTAPDGDWQQIVMFLSVADVHINRTPLAGVVESVTYRPGRFLAAFTAESGAENERSEIVVVDEVDGRRRRIVFRQIVGLLARRVVTRVGPGDVLTAGQRIGLMKFGSRMDVFVPPEVEILARVGDKTVAGETVIARWPSAVPAPAGGAA